MTTLHNSQVRGRVARFTLLDSRGNPVSGNRSVVVSKGIATVQISEVAESTLNSAERSELDNKRRIIVRQPGETVRYDVDINLIGVDPDLLHLLTGYPIVYDAKGNVVGNDATVYLPPANYAMEVWTRLSPAVGEYRYGRTIFPRLRGGRVRAYGFANASVDIEITGARTTRMNRWGDRLNQAPGWDEAGWDETPWDLGPDDLDLPMGENLHFRSALASYSPEPTQGAQPLPALTP